MCNELAKKIHHGSFSGLPTLKHSLAINTESPRQGFLSLRAWSQAMRKVIFHWPVRPKDIVFGIMTI